MVAVAPLIGTLPVSLAHLSSGSTSFVKTKRTLFAVANWPRLLRRWPFVCRFDNTHLCDLTAGGVVPTASPRRLSPSDFDFLVETFGRCFLRKLDGQNCMAEIIQEIAQPR